MHPEHTVHLVSTGLSHTASLYSFSYVESLYRESGLHSDSYISGPNLFYSLGFISFHAVFFWISMFQPEPRLKLRCLQCQMMKKQWRSHDGTEEVPKVWTRVTWLGVKLWIWWLQISLVVHGKSAVIGSQRVQHRTGSARRFCWHSQTETLRGCVRLNVDKVTRGRLGLELMTSLDSDEHLAADVRV